MNVSQWELFLNRYIGAQCTMCSKKWQHVLSSFLQIVIKLSNSVYKLFGKTVKFLPHKKLKEWNLEVSNDCKSILPISATTTVDIEFK